jgi:hypothetical protein
VTGQGRAGIDEKVEHDERCAEPESCGDGQDGSWRVLIVRVGNGLV